MDKALRHRVNAARVAIRNQVAFFNELKGRVASEWKADDTRVTFADFAISENVIKELRATFKSDQFLSEETAPQDEPLELDARYFWVLDPIDGTNNYALGLPGSAISLGLFKAGHPVYGLVYDGSTNELLEGGKGFPIRINGRKHSVPSRSFDRRSGMVAAHFPLPSGRTRQLEELLETYRVRSLGSAALHLAYAALGRLDGVIDEDTRLWDIAASISLAYAGGIQVRFLGETPFPVKQFQMKDSRLRYLAGNPAFLQEMENWLG